MQLDSAHVRGVIVGGIAALIAVIGCLTSW